MSEYSKTVLSSVITMLFMSIYTTVDGMFLSKYVCTDAMAAINICYPIVNVMFAIGFGLAIGGSTRIAYAVGKRDRESADKRFSILIYIAIGISFFMILVLLFRFDQLLVFLGATERLLGYCRIYAGIAILSYPIGIMKEILVAVMRTQEMSGLGMISSVTGGIVNIILDYIFIKFLNYGVMGAAIATTIGMMTAVVINIVSICRKGEIAIVKVTPKDFYETAKILKLSISAGIMELSYAVTTWTFNQLVLKYGSENGVAAFTVIGYIQYALAAVFIGMGNGIVPFLAEYYGADDKKKLRQTIKKSMAIAVMCGILVSAAGYFLAGPAVAIFLAKDTELFGMAKSGVEIIAVSYLLMGVNIIITCSLNSMERGKSAAVLTFFRTVFFPVTIAVLLAGQFQIKGIWMAYIYTEIITLIMSILIYKKSKKRGIECEIKEI